MLQSQADMLHGFSDLSTANEQLLLSISIGNSATEAFAEQFADLYERSIPKLSDAAAQESGRLVPIHRAASDIISIAAGLIDVETVAKGVEAELMTDIEGILQSMALDDIHVHGEPAASTKVSPTGGKESLCTETGDWLVHNIHHPFPSLADKQRFARQGGATMKAIGDWFTNARRKIGWAAFSKRYFRGNRCSTLECAHRVFVQGEEQGEYCEEIVRDLKNIKATAERLYGNTGKQNTSEPSSFAKELESIEAKTSLNNRRKRRLSTSSSGTERSSTSRSTSSIQVPASQKRSRESSEESDVTSRSEGLDPHSSRPLKRGRSASSVSTSPSQKSSDSSSSTACSSESNETLCEVVTPGASPNTRSKLPPELFHDWFDGVSAEPGFLPLPHGVDDGPSTPHSRKRALPDSDSGSDADAPRKRARLDGPSPPAVEEEGNDKPNVKHGPSTVTVATHLGPERGSQDEIPSTKDSFSLLPVLAPLSLPEQVFPELDEATVNDILAHLDFSIPQPPILPAPEESPLTGPFEAGLNFFDSSLLLGSGSSSGLTFADADAGDINALLANYSAPDGTLSASASASEGQVVTQQYTQQVCTGNASEIAQLFGDANPEDASTGSSTIPALPTFPFPELPPLSFSPLDLAFLENLSSASQTGILSSSPQDASSTLVDVPSLSVPDVNGVGVGVNVDCNEKLKRIDQLLAEAQKLQQEVFG